MLRDEDDFKVGDWLIWNPSLRLCERILVTAVYHNSDDETWVQTENEKGDRYWNDEQRMRESCRRVLS